MEIGGGMNCKRKHDLASGGLDFGGGSGAPCVGPTSIGWHVLPIRCWFSSRLYGLGDYRKALEKAIADDQSTQDSAQSDALGKRITLHGLPVRPALPTTGR
jgi:hypothetical protein